MKSLIDNIKETKKLSEGIVNIPFHYIILLVTLFLMWKPYYIELIDASSWVPENIENILLGIVNLVYSNIFIIFLLLAIIFIVLFVLDRYTKVFDKNLPENANYTDNITIEWNQYSAMTRVIKISFNLISVFWIYYFLINILFNKNNYVKNFLIHNSNIFENELITTGYMTSNNLEFMNMLFWLNIMIIVYLIVRSLFEIKIPTDKYFIEYDDLKLYIQLNSFKQKNSNGEKSEIIILKDKYQSKPNFYLISVQLTRQEIERVNDQTKIINITLPVRKRIYKVINYSENLNEIIYHFESSRN